jgi:CYTH domain-containing protein
MKIEIERKFLLASEDWRLSVERSDIIRDGLISSDEERKVRVRIAGARATLTVKTKRVAGARQEFEYEIPFTDAERLMVTCGDVIEKVRHYVRHGSLVWEIDEYRGVLAGVIIAEVELTRVDEVVDLPPWVAQEITEQEEWRKRNMIRLRGGFR